MDLGHDEPLHCSPEHTAYKLLGIASNNVAVAFFFVLRRASFSYATVHKKKAGRNNVC